MNFLEIIGAIIVIAGGISAWFFRKGGVYNPIQPPNPPTMPQNSPVEPPTPHTPTPSHLDTFCLGIRDFEGAPGDANYRNNNPGNCRYNPGGYLPKYGDVKESPAGFAIFPTYEQGWEYLQALVLQLAKKHPTWTFLDFFNFYAPPSDNNPTTAYATFVAKRCGMPVDSLIDEYLL